MHIMEIPIVHSSGTEIVIVKNYTYEDYCIYPCKKVAQYFTCKPSSKL